MVKVSEGVLEGLGVVKELTVSGRKWFGGGGGGVAKKRIREIRLLVNLGFSNNN